MVGVSAADSDGTVANVRLMTNGVFAATNSVAPFGFSLSNLPPGHYSLRARAQEFSTIAADAQTLLNKFFSEATAKVAEVTKKAA